MNNPNGNFDNFNFAPAPPPVQERENSETDANASVQASAASQAAGAPMQGAPAGVPNGYAPQPTAQAPSYTVPNTQMPNFVYTPAGYSQPYGGYNQQYNRPQQSPVAIYNNAQNGNAPQYHYGYGMQTPFINQAYYKEQQEKAAKRREAEKKIKKVGNISGIVLLGSFGISFLFSVLYVIPAIETLIRENLSVSYLYNMLYSIFGVGVAFVLFSRLYSSIKAPAYPGAPLQTPPKEYKTSFALPKDGYKTLLLIVIAFGGCMLANYISSVILAVFEGFGVYSTYSSIEDPKTTGEIITLFLSIAVIPPLIEELALRGVVMSNLRRYGNAFAIIASAFMFGIFHGTAAQILFAFLCGLFFGYITIATESIWPAIIVHAINNSLSCITSVLLQVTDESTANVFYTICSLGGIILAGLGVLLYIKSYGNDKVLSYNGEEDCLTTGQKIKSFLLSPAMIAIIILYTLMALGTLTTNINNIQ